MTARRRWDRRMAPREDAVYTCDVALSREACLPACTSGLPRSAGG